jgi:hypothetical protein
MRVDSIEAWLRDRVRRKIDPGHAGHLSLRPTGTHRYWVNEDHLHVKQIGAAAAEVIVCWRRDQALPVEPPTPAPP